MQFRTYVASGRPRSGLADPASKRRLKCVDGLRSVRTGGANLDLIPFVNAETHQCDGAASIDFPTAGNDGDLSGEPLYRGYEQRGRAGVYAVLERD